MTRGFRVSQSRVIVRKLQATPTPMAIMVPRRGKGLKPTYYNFTAISPAEIRHKLTAIPSCAKYAYEAYDFCIGSRAVSDAELASYLSNPLSKPLELTIKSKARSFSHFDHNHLDAALSYANVSALFDEGLAGSPIVNVTEAVRKRIEEMGAVIESIVVQARLIGKHTRKNAYAEMVSRALIDLIMYGAMGVVNHPGAVIDMEIQIKGSMAHGPLDYAVGLLGYWLAVQEAKAPESQLLYGLPQLIAQMVACREQFRRDRESLVDREGKLTHLIDAIPSYGIISTGKLWQVVQYKKNENGDWKLIQGKVMSLSTRASDDTLKDEVVQLLTHIASVCIVQINEIEQYYKTFNNRATELGLKSAHTQWQPGMG